MTMQLRFESENLNKYLDNLINRFPAELSDATRRTAIAGTRTAKSKLPSRSGALRASVTFRRVDPFTYLIWHGRSLKSKGQLKYAEAIEAGRRALTIYPRRKKMLLFPIRDDVVTKGGQVKASAKKALFAELKRNKKRKKNEKLQRKEIFEKTGLVLAKKADQKKRAGQWNYRDRIRPIIETRYKMELVKKFRTLGFV